MARSERVAASGFGQFMASTAGRVTRCLAGIALIVVGFVLGGIGGWTLADIEVVGVGVRLEPTGSRPEDTQPAEPRDLDSTWPSRRAGRLRAGSACDWMHHARDSRSLAPRDRLLRDAGWTTGIPRGGCSVEGNGRGRVASRTEAPRTSGSIPEHERPGIHAPWRTTVSCSSTSSPSSAATRSRTTHPPPPVSATLLPASVRPRGARQGGAALRVWHAVAV